MSAVEEILQSLPMDQLAGELGVDLATTERAVASAITTLLGGLTQNAQSEPGEQALVSALSDHASDNHLWEGDSVNLGEVDTGDGEKILNHVFGNQTDSVVHALGGQDGMSSSLISKLLPILAPIVLGYLARNMSVGKYGDVLGPILAGGAVGGGAGVLQDILGQVLEGTLAQNDPMTSGNEQQAPARAPLPGTEQQSGGDILGQILGGLFGRK